jgi:uncharacterized protein YdaU (DUF1376 family)
MRLYWGDYFRDTRRLSLREHGAYLLLLGELWVQGGKLPADDDTLARAALCTPAEWAEIRPTIMPFFRVVRGKLTQKRLAEELAKYDDTIRKRKLAGQKGGRATRGNGEENTEANAKQLPTKPEPEPEPITQKEDKLLSVTHASRFGFEEWWSLYPNAVAKPVARKAYAAALAQIGGPDPDAVLLDGLRRSLASARWNDPTYTKPNPAKWLAEERWNDRDAAALAEPLAPPAQITVPSAIHEAIGRVCGDTFASSYLCGAVVEDGDLRPKTRTAWERIAGNRHAVAALNEAGLRLVRPDDRANDTNREEAA